MNSWCPESALVFLWYLKRKINKYITSYLLPCAVTTQRQYSTLKRTIKILYCKFWAFFFCFVTSWLMQTYLIKTVFNIVILFLHFFWMNAIGSCRFSEFHVFRHNYSIHICKNESFSSPSQHGAPLLHRKPHWMLHQWWKEMCVDSCAADLIVQPMRRGRKAFKWSEVLSINTTPLGAKGPCPVLNIAICNPR